MQEAKGNVLPKLTQDIQQCRRDLDKWGYCLIDKCCSDAQVAMYRERLHEQAEAELLAGVNNGPSRPSMRQNVWSLINKGGDSRMFEDFLECEYTATICHNGSSDADRCCQQSTRAACRADPWPSS
eukprot:COSAG04_NODE_1055_length_8548_cov_3.532970_8_plen_126_part_00